MRLAKIRDIPKFVRQLLGFSPFIHIFGDSHASFCFTNTTPVATTLEKSLFESSAKISKVPFAINWLGPITMHRVGRDGITFLNLKEKGVKNDQVAVFVFGEIDVRCHIEKHSQKLNCPLDKMIQSLVEGYLKTIEDNRRLFHKLQCIVCTIVPPTDNMFNPDFPYFGTLATRVDITRRLNEKLRQACASRGIAVLDLYENYCTPQGDLDLQYSDGSVHLAAKYNNAIKQELLQLLTI
jgi:hypothetical protein